MSLSFSSHNSMTENRTKKDSGRQPLVEVCRGSKAMLGGVRSMGFSRNVGESLSERNN